MVKRHLIDVLDAQKIRFIVVGVINTLIDFLILNALAHGLGVALIPANIASATVAMTFSFFANRSIVFDGDSGDRRRQAMLFIGVTVTSVYLIQNLVIWILSEWWRWPLDTTHQLVEFIDREVFVTNISKLSATAVSLVWNFVFYKKLVFVDHEKAK